MQTLSWTPSFTQVNYLEQGVAGFTSFGVWLCVVAMAAAALLMLVWVLMLRRRQTGVRVAIGLAALVLLPNAVLAGSCLLFMACVFPVWTALLLAAPVLAIALSFIGIGWIALLWRQSLPSECGRCRHPMQDTQSTCPECGWQRGRPRAVRQAKVQALVVCCGVSAFVSLLFLRIAIVLPMTWGCVFSAEIHGTPPVHLAHAPGMPFRASSGAAPGVLAGEEVGGQVSQRMALSDAVWDPFFDPSEIQHLAFLQHSMPTVRTSYDVILGDRASYTAEVLAGLEARLADRARRALPTRTQAEAESLAALQASFVRGLCALDKVRGTATRAWAPPIEWVDVTVLAVDPPLWLVLSTAAFGPCLVGALIWLVRRRP